MAVATKPMTKSALVGALAESAEISKKQAAAVLAGLADQIKGALGKKGAGTFVVPGLMKLKVVVKPAVPAQERMNPFTKQMQMFKAKPARKVVKVRPLKALKDMVK